MFAGNEIAGVFITRGGTLAIELAKFLTRFLSLPTPARALLPIWTLATYVYDLFDFTSYLNIVSPEPGCGKTTAADVLSTLCCHATPPTCGTAAYLRRKIDQGRCVLIVDEWDSLEPAVRRLCTNFLNTGYKSDGKYGTAGAPGAELSTFCPKVIVGTSVVRLAETTQSRCITVRMQKVLPEEKLEKFTAQQRGQAEALVEQCEAWAAGFRAQKVHAKPVCPEGFDGRQQDISEPLLTVADSCGGPWPLALRNALTELFARHDLPTTENELLRAVRRYIDDSKKNEYILSREFCAWANAQEETPWSPQQPLTPAAMAEMLRHYGIFATQINRMNRGKQKNGRGYYIQGFSQVFARYLKDKS